MVKKEKAFQVPPRSLFDLAASNDLAQLSISVKGINPHDTSPGSLVLSQKQRPASPDGMSTVGSAARAMVSSITASMVAFERDVGGCTALHVAAAHGHLEMVRLLVEEYHSDVNSTSDSGKTALYVAVEQGHEAIVRFLLAQPGIELRSLTVEGKKSPFTIAAEKQQHAISVRLDAALERTGYDPSTIDPIEAALQGDVFFFSLEKAHMDAVQPSQPTEAAERFSRIAFAQDPAKNSIIASIALQREQTEGQLDVARFLLANGMCGDVNVANASKNTALHNVALSCGEKNLSIPALETRVALLTLLLEHGGDARRQNASGNTPAMSTDNPVMKLHLIAAEKKALFMDSYVKRNQIPFNARPAFAAACKDLKRAWRAADVAAAKALKDPRSVALPSSAQSSTKSSPKTSARGPAKTQLKLVILSASNLPTPAAPSEPSEAPADDGSVASSAPQLDAFISVVIGGTVVYHTPVASASSNPVWSDASVVLDVVVGDSIELRIEDKELPIAPTAQPLGTATVLVDATTIAGCELTLPIANLANDAVLQVRFEKI